MLNVAPRSRTRLSVRVRGSASTSASAGQQRCFATRGNRHSLGHVSGNGKLLLERLRSFSFSNVFCSTSSASLHHRHLLSLFNPQSHPRYHRFHTRPLFVEISSRSNPLGHHTLNSTIPHTNHNKFASTPQRWLSSKRSASILEQNERLQEINKAFKDLFAVEDRAITRDFMTAQREYIHMINSWRPNLGWKMLWKYFLSYLHHISFVLPISIDAVNKVISGHLVQSQEVEPNPIEQYNVRKFLTAFIKYKVEVPADTILLLLKVACKLKVEVNHEAAALLNFVHDQIPRLCTLKFMEAMMDICASEGNSTVGLLIYGDLNRSSLQPTSRLSFSLLETFMKSGNIQGALGLLEHLVEANMLPIIPAELFEKMAKQFGETNPNYGLLVLSTMKTLMEKGQTVSPTPLIYEYCLASFINSAPSNGAVHPSLIANLNRLLDEMNEMNISIHDETLFNRLLSVLAVHDLPNGLIEAIDLLSDRLETSQDSPQSLSAAIGHVNVLLAFVYSRKQHSLSLWHYIKQLRDITGKYRLPRDLDYYTWQAKLTLDSGNPNLSTAEALYEKMITNFGTVSIGAIESFLNHGIDKPLVDTSKYVEDIMKYSLTPSDTVFSLLLAYNNDGIQEYRLKFLLIFSLIKYAGNTVNPLSHDSVVPISRTYEHPDDVIRDIETDNFPIDVFPHIMSKSTFIQTIGLLANFNTPCALRILAYTDSNEDCKHLVLMRHECRSLILSRLDCKDFANALNLLKYTVLTRKFVDVDLFTTLLKCVETATPAQSKLKVVNDTLVFIQTEILTHATQPVEKHAIYKVFISALFNVQMPSMKVEYVETIISEFVTEFPTKDDKDFIVNAIINSPKYNGVSSSSLSFFILNKTLEWELAISQIQMTKLFPFSRFTSLNSYLQFLEICERNEISLQAVVVFDAIKGLLTNMVPDKRFVPFVKSALRILDRTHSYLNGDQFATLLAAARMKKLTSVLELLWMNAVERDMVKSIPDKAIRTNVFLYFLRVSPSHYSSAVIVQVYNAVKSRTEYLRSHGLELFACTLLSLNTSNRMLLWPILRDLQSFGKRADDINLNSSRIAEPMIAQPDEVGVLSAYLSKIQVLRSSKDSSVEYLRNRKEKLIFDALVICLRDLFRTPIEPVPSEVADEITGFLHKHHQSMATAFPNSSSIFSFTLPLSLLIELLFIFLDVLKQPFARNDDPLLLRRRMLFVVYGNVFSARIPQLFQLNSDGTDRAHSEQLNALQSQFRELIQDSIYLPASQQYLTRIDSNTIQSLSLNEIFASLFDHNGADVSTIWETQEQRNKIMSTINVPT